MFCAAQFATGGSDGYLAGMIGGLVFGLISVAGVWTMGLTKSTDPDNDEWMTAIK